MKRYSDKLLTVAFIFVIFFIATMLLIPVCQHLFHLDMETRGGLLAVSVVQNLFAFIAPSVVAARIIAKSPGKMLRLNRAPSLRAVAGILITFLIVYPALNQIIYWNANIQFPAALEALGAQLKAMEESAQKVTSEMLSTGSLGGLFVNLLIVAILTAFGEELFFRGTLQTTAASGGSPHTAIWVVALVFSAFHFQVYGFVPRLLLGAWFGYLLFWTKSIYVPVIAHAVNNGVVVVCTWMAGNELIPSDFEMLGVSEYGFPLPAFISSLATVVFLYYCKDYFFRVKKKSVVSHEETPITQAS